MAREYVLKDSITAASGTTNRTYTTSMDMVDILPDGTADVTVTVNGLSIVVKQSERLNPIVDPFTVMSVTSTGGYRVYVYDMRIVE